MTTDVDAVPMKDPESELETALIAEFVRARGHDEVSLAALSPDARVALLTEASRYATGKLAEVEARAHYVHDIHGATADNRKLKTEN